MHPRTTPATATTTTTDIEIITKEMAADDKKCGVVTIGSIQFLCIPAENEHHYGIMCAFLKNCGIEPRKKSPIRYGVLIPEKDTTKLADILREDDTLFTDYVLIFIGIDHVMQASSFTFTVEKTSKIARYAFTSEAGCKAMQSIAPNLSLMTATGKHCEMKPSEILKLKTEDRKSVVSNINRLMKSYCDQQDIVKEFVDYLPKEHLRERPAYEDEILTLKLPLDCITLLKPAFKYALAKTNTEGVCQIPAGAFKQLGFIEEAKLKIQDGIRKLSVISTFQRALLTLNEYQYSLDNNLLRIRFSHIGTTDILANACKLAGLRLTFADSHQVDIYCDDIFNLNEADLEKFRKILEQRKKEYIKEHGQNQAVTHINDEKNIELETLSLIKVNDARAFNQHIKTHRLDVNKPFTIDKFVGATMVLLASTQGCDAVLECLLDQHKAEFREPMKSGIHAGMTPLYAAAHMGQTVTLQMLIDRGADCNQPLPPAVIEPGNDGSGQNFAGRRPIFAASSSGHAHAVECLISNGADFTTPLESGVSKGMTVFANAVIHVRADVVTLLLLHDVDHTARINNLSPIQTAQKAGDNTNKRKEAYTIIKLIKDEIQCMEIMLEFFMTYPFTPNMQAYTWVKSDHKIHLAVPCSEDLIPYLLTFLENQEIDCRQINDTTLLIPKTDAKRLLSIIDANKSAWDNYILFLSRLGACIRSSSYDCESVLTNSELRLSIPDPRRCGIDEFLVEPYVKQTNTNTYVIPLINLIQLKPDVSARWANTFLKAVRSHKEEFEKIAKYLSSCLSQCSTIAENAIKNGHISVKLNPRSTALARSLLAALNSEQKEGMYWLSMTNFLKLSEDQRLSLMNEIKLRHRIFEAITLLSSQVGQRKISYTEEHLIMKYNKALDAKRFTRIINTHTQLATISDTVVTLNYDALFTLEDNALLVLHSLFDKDTQRLSHEAKVVKSMTRLVNLFEPEKACWSMTGNVLQTTNSSARTLALLKFLNTPGLSIETTPAIIARIDIEATFHCSELELHTIEEATVTIIRKNKIISNFLQKAHSSGVRSTETEAGIELFCLDVQVRNCLTSSCSKVLIDHPSKNDTLLIDYNKFLQLDIEALEQLAIAFAEEIQAYKLRADASKRKPAVATSPKQETVKDPAVIQPGNAAKSNDTSSSRLFSSNNAKKSKNKNRPAKQKVGQGNKAPESVKKRVLTKAERRANSVAPQPPIDTSIAKVNIHTDPHIAKKTLNANPEQFSVSTTTQNKHLHVISSNRFFTCTDNTNAADAINDSLEELSACFARYDYYKNEADFDLSDAIEEMLKLLRELKVISHFLKQPNALNLHIRLFLQHDLEAFSSVSVKNPPSHETILKAAQRGSELWRASEQADSLLSMNI